MNLDITNFDKLIKINSFESSDLRGKFVKIFNFELFSNFDINFEVKEAYYSKSKKDVIRGMHFQSPPKEHEKIVFASKGEILDVCVDLRLNSQTYGQIYNTIISSKNNTALFIPKGFAHGFLTLSKTAIVNYLQTSTYSKEHDQGILWNSINFEWPCHFPIVSDRDKSFITLTEYKNNFYNYFIQ